jgi:serine/threonine protein kinase
MAVVYLGRQLSLGRDVAIKVLNSTYATRRDFVRRFDQEAGALAALNHPNIVNIIDKGFEGRHYYFVMEHVAGRTLEQLMLAMDLGFKHYAHIVAEISKALEYVHSQKVIHRDIKPSNILVAPNWQVKVSDFGIAHIVEDETVTEERVEGRQRRATVGTAFYMAPEQATNPNAVDRRADVYALGVTFYKLFTKSLPQRPVSQWPPVSELNPMLPLGMDSILKKAMDSYPDQRYPTVRAFCDEVLRAFADHRDGRAAAGGALLESSSLLFERALKKEQSRPASAPVPGLSSSSDPDTGKRPVLAGLDSTPGGIYVPTLGWTPDKDSSIGYGVKSPEPIPDSASISRLAQLDQVLGSGLGKLPENRVESAPLAIPVLIEQTPLPESVDPSDQEPLVPPQEPAGISIAVWILLVVILFGAGYLLFLAFTQAS